MGAILKDSGSGSLSDRGLASTILVVDDDPLSLKRLYDPVLLAEAENEGAIVLGKPLGGGKLVEAIRRLFCSQGSGKP